ncbi:MAG TPA: hypothetical protein P5080_05085 [Candidatus Paceibacterota bacterium]|nr:hypothetical protein [Candidatus Pacearchaeota archaeon]HRZ51321.1 hypothetical protein [Candidatus Paceibacterota bacterium]HSA37043.1 hypothetical protein [Candidatus Paceibacterota bacterium]
MVLSDNDIAKFQELYEKYLGKKIGKQEAYEKGIKLVNLMSLIYKPITQEELDRVEARRKATKK